MGTGSAKAYAHSEQGGGFEAIRAGTGQVVVVTSNVFNSVAFSPKTTIVRLFSTVDCFLAFGNNPAMNGSSFFMPGGIIDYIGVDGGMKIQTLRSSTDGVLYLTEGG